MVSFVACLIGGGTDRVKDTRSRRGNVGQAVAWQRRGATIRDVALDECKISRSMFMHKCGCLALDARGLLN